MTNNKLNYIKKLNAPKSPIKDFKKPLNNNILFEFIERQKY